MAAGLSNQEIADQLYLSLNTIKWYARHIFSKLAVNKRTQAVARAQELGIL
jgi:LuxR family maltose regulon positive regulatory protein